MTTAPLNAQLTGEQIERYYISVGDAHMVGDYSVVEGKIYMRASPDGAWVRYTDIAARESALSAEAPVAGLSDERIAEIAIEHFSCAADDSGDTYAAAIRQAMQEAVPAAPQDFRERICSALGEHVDTDVERIVEAIEHLRAQCREPDAPQAVGERVLVPRQLVDAMAATFECYAQCGMSNTFGSGEKTPNAINCERYAKQLNELLAASPAAGNQEGRECDLSADDAEFGMSEHCRSAAGNQDTVVQGEETVVVPLEPTREMLREGALALQHSKPELWPKCEGLIAAYKAMLEAALRSPPSGRR